MAKSKLVEKGSEALSEEVLAEVEAAAEPKDVYHVPEAHTKKKTEVVKTTPGHTTRAFRS